MRLLSLAPPFRGSPHAGGGREGGRRGRRQGGRQEGGRREGMPAGTYLLPRGAPPVYPTPDQQDRCAAAGPPPSHTDVPAAAGRAPGVGNAMGLLPQVRGTQGPPYKGQGTPVTATSPRVCSGGQSHPGTLRGPPLGLAAPQQSPCPPGLHVQRRQFKQGNKQIMHRLH